MEMNSAEPKRHGKHVPVWAYILSFVIVMTFLVILALAMGRSDDEALVVGAKAPDFQLITFDGDTLNTAEMRGKVVLVNFWASWCGPCSQEAEDLQKAWLAYQDSGEVVFLGVDYVDTEQEAQEYLSQYQVSYPNGADLKSGISRLYRIRGVPETFIIDRSGNLARMKIGPFNSYEELKNMLDEVLTLSSSE